MPRLTDVSIKSLPLPASGQITYDDDNSPLKVRVSRGGAKTFIVMLGSGRRRTIGRCGEVSLADARQAARRLRAQKTLGAILPSSKTVEEARTEYLQNIKVRSSTRLYYTRHLSKLSGRIVDIDAAKLNTILDPLAETARNQNLASFRAFFNWCIRRHYLDLNPCRRLLLTKQKGRERTLTDAELRAVWHACSDDSFGNIVRLLILTGQRKGEIAAMRSHWLNDDGTVTFPAAITKNGEQHTLPLPELAKQLLRALPKPAQPHPLRAQVGTYSGSILLFPSSKSGTVISGWMKLRATLDKECKVIGWTLHDLRRTFATIHAKIGTPPHVTEALLNHKTGSLSPIAKVYNRYKYEAEMREAMNAYDAYISRLISATDSQ